MRGTELSHMCCLCLYQCFCVLVCAPRYVCIHVLYTREYVCVPVGNTCLGPATLQDGLGDMELWQPHWLGGLHPELSQMPQVCHLESLKSKIMSQK